MVTPDEALQLLTKARNLDNKIGPVDKVRAAAWADELPDVTLRAAMVALSRHYRDSAETFNIGHVRPLARVVMREWKDQKRINDQMRSAVERASATAIESPRMADVQMTPRELIEFGRQRRAERAARNPEFAAALEQVEATTPPSRPGALTISGSLGSGRGGGSQADSDALRGRAMPQALGSLLGRIANKLQEGS